MLGRTAPTPYSSRFGHTCCYRPRCRRSGYAVLIPRQCTIDGISEARSGMAWMHVGLQFDLKNFESIVRRIRRVGAT